MKHFDKFANTVPRMGDFSYREIESLRDSVVRPLRCTPGTWPVGNTTDQVDFTGGIDTSATATPIDESYKNTIAEAHYVV